MKEESDTPPPGLFGAAKGAGGHSSSLRGSSSHHHPAHPTPPEATWAITAPTLRGFGPPVPKSCLEVGGYQPGGVRAGEEAPPRKLDQERGQAAGRALRGLERGDGGLHEGRSRATEWTFRAALEGQWQQHSGPWI